MSRIEWVEVDALPPTCDMAPSPNSTARCERDTGHDGEHRGRTQGGRWRIWDDEEETTWT